MWLLINGIGDNEDIKNGLYPLPGGNTSLSKGGSKPKAEYHWALAFHIFENDIEYGEMITAAAKVAKQRAVWGLKVKNKLSRYVSTQLMVFHKFQRTLNPFVTLSLQTRIRDIINEMGETGAGLTAEDQVDLSINSTVTSVWSEFVFDIYLAH